MKRTTIILGREQLRVLLQSLAEVSDNYNFDTKGCGVPAKDVRVFNAVMEKLQEAFASTR